MLTGDAYSSGHLVPFHLGLAYVLHVETNPFPEIVVFSDYAFRISLGTFSLLLEHPSTLTRFAYEFRELPPVSVSRTLADFERGGRVLVE